MIKNRKALLRRKYVLLIPWEIVSEDSEDARNLLDKLLEAAAGDPLILSEMIRGVLHEDTHIKIQAVSMVERVTRVRPLFLALYKRVLLNEFSQMDQPEIRQQVAVLYSRVMWDEWEMKQVVALLSQWIAMEENEYVLRSSIESLHKLVMQKKWIFPEYVECLKKAVEHPNSSIRDLANELLLSD
jgi:hypothetical protein